MSCILLVWLHVVDLGCGADAIGNFFWHLIAVPGFFPGASREARLKALWGRLRTWYQNHKPASVLDNLTVEMVRRSKNTSKPKLKAKGAECRYLVPFCHELATEIAESHPEDHCMQTIAGLFNHLFALQQWVAGSLGPYDFSKASEECRRFCVLYQSLQSQAIFPLWHFKPKIHMMQEMVEFQSEEHGNPREFWCYRDESWCGLWAKASKRRGGHNTPGTTARTFLLRYLALENLAAED